MKAEEYLSVLTDQMRCKMAREAVRDELLCHIEDQKAAFISEGMEKSEAEEAAVREMGDPVAVGTELDRIHRPRMAWNCIILIGVLYLAGLLLQRLLGAQTESSFYGGGVLTYAAKLLFASPLFSFAFLLSPINGRGRLVPSISCRVNDTNKPPFSIKSATFSAALSTMTIGPLKDVFVLLCLALLFLCVFPEAPGFIRFICICFPVCLPFLYFLISLKR